MNREQYAEPIESHLLNCGLICVLLSHIELLSGGGGWRYMLDGFAQFRRACCFEIHKLQRICGRIKTSPD